MKRYPYLYSRGPEEGTLLVGEGLRVQVFRSLPRVFLMFSMGDRSFTHGKRGLVPYFGFPRSTPRRRPPPAFPSLGLLWEALASRSRSERAPGK
eukprot:41507-Pyramimonas_sp.AAC.1